MIASMTGYGRGEVSADGITVAVELRSVNNRFLDVSARLPRSLALRENELKEQLRKTISRGKITLQVTIDKDADGHVPLKVNLEAAKAYAKVLAQLKKSLKIKEPIRLEHLLQFPDVIEQRDAEGADGAEWDLTRAALGAAVEDLARMRKKEGGELEADFLARIRGIETSLATIEEVTKRIVPQERIRLRQRIAQILDRDPVDEGRLEMELAILAEKLDVTEECVRFRSHNKFFLEAIADPEPAGRRLNFLIQEMNREANTIGSKTNSTEIAHLVVGVKEELEKIREQVQNIE